MIHRIITKDGPGHRKEIPNRYCRTVLGMFLSMTDDLMNPFRGAYEDGEAINARIKKCPVQQQQDTAIRIARRLHRDAVTDLQGFLRSPIALKAIAIGLDLPNQEQINQLIEQHPFSQKRKAFIYESTVQDGSEICDNPELVRLSA